MGTRTVFQPVPSHTEHEVGACGAGTDAMGISAKNNTIVPLSVWNLQSKNPACPQDTHSACTKQVAVTISREGAPRESKHYGAQPPSAAGIVGHWKGIAHTDSDWNSLRNKLKTGCCALPGFPAVPAVIARRPQARRCPLAPRQWPLWHRVFRCGPGQSWQY